MTKLAKIIVAVIASLLVVSSLTVGIILLIPEKAPSDTNISSEDSVSVPEENITDAESVEVIKKEESSENYKDGEFVDNTDNEQKFTSSGELGGSTTLDVIKPDVNNNSSTEVSSIEWIEGIW